MYSLGAVNGMSTGSMRSSLICEKGSFSRDPNGSQGRNAKALNKRTVRPAGMYNNALRIRDFIPVVKERANITKETWPGAESNTKTGPSDLRLAPASSWSRIAGRWRELFLVSNWSGNWFWDDNSERSLSVVVSWKHPL